MGKVLHSIFVSEVLQFVDHKLNTNFCSREQMPYFEGLCGYVTFSKAEDTRKACHCDLLGSIWKCIEESLD